MKTKITKLQLTLAATLIVGQISAQQGVTQFGRPTGQPAFPVEEFIELPDHNAPKPEQWTRVSKPQAQWANSNQRYAKHEVPQQGLTSSLRLTAWQGETLNAQALVWSGADAGNITLAFTPFKSGSRTLPASALSASFLRYTMADYLLNGNNCGHRDHAKLDSVMVADVIDHITPQLALPAMTTQPLWVQCHVPVGTPAGTYKGNLVVSLDGKTLKSLPLQIEVKNRSIGAPSDYAFHLDLWQSPYAVARYHQVEPWSEAHLEAMRPIMTRLGNAGQKIITATIMHKPWGGQTEDYFESMVNWTRKIDGSWQFDYDIFDRWVEFMMSCGIDQQINCYSMIPWALSFQYFDQATNSLKAISTKPGEPAYEELWTAMLTSFAKHLKEKGWFDITTIAMDERPMAAMQQAFKIIRKAAPDFKVSLAGNYHPEIEADLYDYCITIHQKFPEDVLARRKAEGKRSTYYTCCTEQFPNTFTISPPAESAWLGYFCAKDSVDGYLRWAYNSWVVEPLLDTRFRTWSAGDTYMVYPGDRTSIRFEKLVEGIQAYEKIRILRDELRRKNDSAGLRRLEKALSRFNLRDFPDITAEEVVIEAQKVINSF